MLYSNNMSVILSSFKKSKKILNLFDNIKPYSVSRFNPSGYPYERLEFLSAYDVNGNRLRLKGSSPEQYRHEWLKYIVKNKEIVFNWLDNLDNNVHILLCCWCPYSQSIKKQIKNYGSFVCHTGLIGNLINKYRPDIELILDKDRVFMLYRKYLPDNFKNIEV